MGLFYKWHQAKGAKSHSILTVTGETTTWRPLADTGLVEKWQPDESAVAKLAQRVNDGQLKCLFIGNSITLHPINDYWWGEWGMAADAQENDYVHVVTSALAKNVRVNYNVCNFSTWEVMSHDRGEVLPMLDTQLASDYDLIVIQLGENVKDVTTLQADFSELIRYCRGKAPNAAIIVVGNFWQNDTIEEAKEAASAAENVSFADLKPIMDSPEAECSMGSVVKDKNGNTHEVQHAGVAKHPNNLGMQVIANIVLQAALQ